MKVALIGAGALGQLFAYCLVEAGFTVRFVPAGKGDTRDVLHVTTARRAARTVDVEKAADDDEFDFAILAVRANQVDDRTLAQLARLSHVPLLALTPLLPATLSRVESVVETVVPSMPSVAVRFDDDGRLAYWCPPGGPTLIEGDPRRGIVAPLIQALRRGGLPIRTGKGVAGRNWATTITFFSLQVAVCCAGGSRAWLDDTELFRLSMRAARECRQVARRLGRADPGIVALARLAPMLRLVRGVLHAWFPAAFAYVDHHFGAKLVAQHRSLLDEITSLGVQHGIELRSLEELGRRLPSSSPPTSPRLLPSHDAPDVD